jgi:hypothetical protein
MPGRILTAFLFAIIAAAALAQETAPARFFIERIEVRNAHRVAPRVVIAESLLREGNEYSENELREAAARLSRLPFLLSSDFALEKGSERGRHVLVINVVETKPFFFLLDGRATVRDNNSQPVDYDFDPAAQTNDGALGFRWFVGGRGIVHAGMSVRRGRQAFSSAYTAWEVGYTQYDVIGTRAFVTVNLRVPVDSKSAKFITPQIVAGIPLTTSQTLTLDYDDTVFENGTVRLLGNDYRNDLTERVLTLAWTYNTTNEPFVPTLGTFVRVAPFRTMRDRTTPHSVPATIGGLPRFDVIADHTSAEGADITGFRYWELSEINSVSGGLAGGWANVDQRRHPPLAGAPDSDSRQSYEVLQGGYSRKLHRFAPKNGESRLELDGRIVLTQLNPRNGAEGFGAEPLHQRSYEASASWVRRSLWGTLRLGVTYGWGY